MNNLAPFNPMKRQTLSRPARNVGLFGDLFDTFLNDDFLKAFPEGSDLLLRPNLDIAESEKEYTVLIEIPGVEEKDIKLEAENGKLTVSGEKKRETEEEDKNWHRVERSYGSFQRILSLPEDVSEDDINASFKNGILTVSMPRRKEANANKKTIKIKKA